MSLLLENILTQIKQLNPQEQLQLITYLLSQNLAAPPPRSENPWIATTGSLVNDPFFEEYIEAIERYRQEIDSQPQPENPVSENSSAA